MTNSVNGLLLAAGLGTRLRPLTLRYPKPCIPFLNVPMGLYQFRFLEHIRVDQLVVNTFHLPKQIEALFNNQPYYNGQVTFSHESPAILGNGGGLKKASEQMDLSKPILLMNADEIYLTKDTSFLKRALDQHLANNNLATLVAMNHPEAGKKFGAVWSEGSRVTNIMTAGKSPANNQLKPWHYIGALFISPEVVARIPDHLELNVFYDVIIHELSSNRVEIFPLECDWFETGNPVDYLSATHEVLKKADASLLKFISQYDPSELVKNEKTTTLLSRKAQVLPKNLFGYNVLSKSVIVNATDEIRDSVLFDQEVLNARYFTQT